jgi:hypothetical protein
VEPTGPEHVDLDLWRLLNAWGVPRAHAVPVVAPAPQRAGERPSALLVGCSFSWTLLRDAGRSGAFGELDMNYYNKTFVSWPADGRLAVDPKTEAWREATLDKDLIVLDLTETYLFAYDAYSTQFVDELAAALGVN